MMGRAMAIARRFIETTKRACFHGKCIAFGMNIYRASENAKANVITLGKSLSSFEEGLRTAQS